MFLCVYDMLYMCVSLHLHVIDRNCCLLGSLIFRFHARVHDRVLRSLKTSAGVHF
jgi:lauroyl/myristoyl acyltransferase